MYPSDPMAPIEYTAVFRALAELNERVSWAKRPHEPLTLQDCFEETVRVFGYIFFDLDTSLGPLREAQKTKKQLQSLIEWINNGTGTDQHS